MTTMSTVFHRYLKGLVTSKKCLVVSVFFRNQRQVSVFLQQHTAKDLSSTSLRGLMSFSHRTAFDLHGSSSSSSSLRMFTSLLQGNFDCLAEHSRYFRCCPSVITLLCRGFQTKPRIKVDDTDDVEDGQKGEQKDSAKEHSAWMLRMSNENNYLSWCRNIYISTLVAYTTSILAPGHFTAEGVFIVIAFANLFFGTSSFIYHTIRMRQKMMMSFIGVVYNILLALIHFLLYVTCISMYAPFSADFIDDDDEESTI